MCAKNAGTILPCRAYFDFHSGVSASDDGTNIDIIGGGVPAANYYVANHTFPGELQNMEEADWLTGGSCKLGGCLELGGTNEYIKILGKNALAGGWTGFTWEGFRRPVYDAAASSAAFQVIGIHKYQTGTLLPQFLIHQMSGASDGGKIRVVLVATDGTRLIDVQTTSNILTAGTWGHIGVVFDNTKACGLGGTGGKLQIFYGSGATFTAQNVTETICRSGTVITDTGTHAFLGSDAGGGTSWPFSGRFDEDHFWSKALSQAELDTQHASGSGLSCAGTETDLIACYHYDETAGTLAANAVALSASGDGLTTSTPFRTCQEASNAIPKFYGGSTTVHLASGVLPETCSFRGFNPNGDFSITVRGNLNAVPNSFTDAAILSGTLESATNAFPADAGTILTDSTTVTVPVQNGTSTATTGGTLAAGTYYYRVSAINRHGETTAFTEISQATTGTTSTVTVNWTAGAGGLSPTGYRVYCRATGAELLCATVGSGVLSWVDTGAVTPSGALPGSNTASAFGTAGTQDNRWLTITGGTGLAVVESNNWYPIWTNTAATTLKLAVKTNVTFDATTTYDIYDPDDMAMFHGGDTRSQGLKLIDANGVQVQLVRARRNLDQGLYALNSKMDLMPTTHTYWQSYNPSGDIWGLYADANSSVGSRQGIGAAIISNTIGAVRKSIFLNNRDLGLLVGMGTQLRILDGNLYRGQVNDAGVLVAYHGTVFQVNNNLALDNSAFFGFDFESGSVSYSFAGNRADGNSGGILVATNAAVGNAGINYFVSSTTRSGIELFGSGTFYPTDDGGIQYSNNNARYGLFCDGNFSVHNPNNAAYYSYSGNTSGTTAFAGGCQSFVGGGLAITFATLGSPPNGTLVYCTDCNATCSAGASTGKLCGRVNGAWAGL